MVNMVFSTLILSNCWKNVIKFIKNPYVVLMKNSGIMLDVYLKIMMLKVYPDHKKIVYMLEVCVRKHSKLAKSEVRRVKLQMIYC